ncbi:adenylyl-sulfate kinase [Francisella philomiragia]|uniref:adenylyl-sulfate kinase n=1 Tax=Francisella philomiragia TaxID=28110 RepID=UPI0019032A0A|nr:adenylyl-sulfate kinase [Francisella philomiragia]MBK2267772.1 adenylyl-sulfate kinase [Francisella philomiragia]MBK2279130.1 adenylyl-sulfate kinase [Francisella philomiragia]MBK2287081.1 adenylyl-sulfate kinase [Francisella philomiragia]MBK2288962.1 adenylyl-sulfate kinase [Francisella philomiragia]MBK2290680.1 adenylyl-sulfate kinase [Francisella philomiragia]
MSKNIVWHDTNVSTDERAKQKNHKALVLWYTGLSGSGKSTIANAVDRMLHQKSYHTYILDGDNIRHGLNRDLGFDEASRIENIRRISEVAKLFVDAGIIVSTAFISPYISDREQARELIGKNNFIEIFIDTELSECENRDPKGLYKKARAGEIADFTGLTSPYQKPVNPEIHIKTQAKSIKDCAGQIFDYLVSNNKI